MFQRIFLEHEVGLAYHYTKCIKMSKLYVLLHHILCLSALNQHYSIGTCMKRHHDTQILTLIMTISVAQ